MNLNLNPNDDDVDWSIGFVIVVDMLNVLRCPLCSNVRKKDHLQHMQQNYQSLMINSWPTDGNVNNESKFEFKLRKFPEWILDGVTINVVDVT